MNNGGSSFPMRFSQLLVLWPSDLCKEAFFFLYQVETNIEDFNLREGSALHSREQCSPKKYMCVYKDVLIAGTKARRLSEILFTNPLTILDMASGGAANLFMWFLSVAGQIDSVSRVHPHNPHFQTLITADNFFYVSAQCACVCLSARQFALAAFCQRLI